MKNTKALRKEWLLFLVVGCLWCSSPHMQGQTTTINSAPQGEKAVWSNSSTIAGSSAAARFHLAQLYRGLGRTTDANKIEAELRDLFVGSDADYTLARLVQSAGNHHGLRRGEPGQVAHPSRVLWGAGPGLHHTDAGALPFSRSVREGGALTGHRGGGPPD